MSTGNPISHENHQEVTMNKTKPAIRHSFCILRSAFSRPQPP